MNSQLTISSIVTNGVQQGIKNFVPLLLTSILYILTIWIPYLNVGTTIGLIGMVAKLGRSETMSPTEIFNPSYRKSMGEFFLVTAFVIFGTIAGTAFLIIPGYVIAIAWGQATLLVLDKGMDPMSAIKKSNDITYGKKWTIFLGSFALMIALGLAAGILMFVGGLIHKNLGAFLMFVAMMLIFPIVIAAQGYIYNTLLSESN